jgi:phosphoglycerate dehydrogenase-like enzyme
MLTGIAVHADFEGGWPFAADYAENKLSRGGPLAVDRREIGDNRPLKDMFTPAQRAEIERLVILGGTVTDACISAFPRLKIAALRVDNPPSDERFRAAGVQVIRHLSEGFWGQSVSEFALALTLCGLRRIPQTHVAMKNDLTVWDYSAPKSGKRAGKRGQQFGDDARFTNGTLCGKRVRIVGMGNIGARFAQFASQMGADVAAWDAMMAEPVFHRTQTRRVYHLQKLVADAEIFLPMMPLRDNTRGIITAELVNALPRGCLVVLVTRAALVDMPTLRRRVLADELALAADVFDVEPLPPEDPLLGRHNVVHTPHNAGRTKEANWALIDALLDQLP